MGTFPKQKAEGSKTPQQTEEMQNSPVKRERNEEEISN